MSASSTPRRSKATFPGSLTDLHRFRKTAHGHDGSSRIVMVRKTDQRTFASVQNGKEPKLETITRETIETFRGQRTECKITTEKKDFKEDCPQDIVDRVNKNSLKKTTLKKSNQKLDFQLECLQAHNEFRKLHGVPPLKLNKEICRVSQEWANNLIKKGVFKHSENPDYGENLFSMHSTDPKFAISGREPVKYWYSELKVHNFNQEPSSLKSGHFTQVIWKQSKEMGIAYARNAGKIVVVAHYYPPGNIIGSFVENVPPIGGFQINNNNNNNNNSCNDLRDSLLKLNITPKHRSMSQRDLQKCTEGNFEEDFLIAHNNYRQMHGVSPLKLDRKLCRYSEEWAKHLASRNILEHRPCSNYGENIYSIYTSDPNSKITGKEIVDKWYEEIKYHPFGKEPNDLKSGHFTQIVWKTSQFLGVGVAKNSQGNIFIVANYSPAGNFVGHYVDNVPDLKPSLGNFENSSGSQEVNLNGQQIFTQFARDSLKVHNEYRRRHGVPDLILNEELCNLAQEWADTCAKASSLTHRANNAFGENLFSVYSSDFDQTLSARDVVKEWYDEMKQYNFGIEKVNQSTLHFTQLIWRSTTELGIGIAKNRKGQIYVVANYNPRGNNIGHFVANVPKSKP